MIKNEIPWRISAEEANLEGERYGIDIVWGNLKGTKSQICQK